MRFIGNKENLIPQIYTILEKHNIIQDSKRFFDMFAGSSSVGRFFKAKGFSVYSCDLLYSSYCLQRAYLQNNALPCFKGLDISSQSQNTRDLFASNYQKLLAFLNDIQPKQGFIYQNYAPSGTLDLANPRMYFSDENAMQIDAIRLQIEVWKKEGAINEDEYFILLATLIESVSFYANVAGVYAAFCKTWDKRALKTFALKELNLLHSAQECFCYCGDSVDILESLKYKTFDILYLDPPYNARQYAPNYHLIETIARYDNPNIKGIAGLREWQQQKSQFCNAKTALNALAKILELKNYKYLVLSYNSEGLLQKEEIEKLLKQSLLKQDAKLHFEEIKYPRFKSNHNKGDKFIKEYLWILRK